MAVCCMDPEFRRRCQVGGAGRAMAACSDDDAQPLPRLSLPGRGHRARGLAVPLLQPQPARRRDDPRRPRHRCVLREHPRVGPALRPAVRQRAEAAPSKAGRQVVHGRGVHPHPGQAALPLACRGPGRSCARHPRAGPAQCQSRQALLPQAAEGLAICAARDRDGQAQELRRREAQGAAPYRAPAKPLPQQPGRGVAPAHAAELCWNLGDGAIRRRFEPTF